MKNKNSKKSQNKSVSVQILWSTKVLTVEASDEKLFEFIKKEFPDIQDYSLYEFNFYIIADTKDNAMKCSEFINQEIANTTKHQASIVIIKSSDKYAVVVTFMEFPFNLEEIKKASKLFNGAAKKTRCEYDSWEIGISGSNKS